jgi:toxin YoeB
MEIVFLIAAQEHLDFWKKTGNKKVLKKISELLRSITETPYHGIGKPEALKHELSGKWSRRIDRKNRIVYIVQENTIYVYSIKGHY